jgi:N,N-dimethylformamidase
MNYFRIYFLVLCCVMSLVLANTSFATDEPKRTIVGYSSELTTRPGDSIEFMVTALKGGTYEADLVRVVNGDNLSRYKDQFKVVRVDSSFAGNYTGANQPLNSGSYVHVEDASALDGLKSFTVAAWIFPTFDPSDYEPPDLDNIDPFSPPSLNIAESISHQTIVSRYDATTNTGWALQIDEDYRLRFISGEQVVVIDQKMKDWDWAYVAASYDADSETVTVHLREKPWAAGDKFTARNLSFGGRVKPVQEGSLRIAAVRSGPGAARSQLEKPGWSFNGRIQDVRIVNRALGAEELDALAAEETPEFLLGDVVANFDFSREMRSDKAVDISPSGMVGQVVNAPERAVRGAFFKGNTVKWVEAPKQYDAIGFHADDMYDAQWSADFSYTIPNGLRSGIYAVRLTQGDFVEYVTFFVAPPKDKPTAKLALWISEYSYLAYANISIGATAQKNYPGHSWNFDDIDFMRANPEFTTGGVYNMHVDGTYYAWGSRLRPDLGMKPGALPYNFVQDTHITAFLEHEGIEYDIITDELVEEEGLALLQQYPAILSSTHHEYVTTGMFDTVDQYTQEGGRFVYTGGNGWFWSVGKLPAYPAALESRNFHEIGERVLTNGDQGGLMIETGRKNGPVFGVEIGAMLFNGGSPYRKLEDAQNPRAAFIFKGTTEGAIFGDYGIDKAHGGVVGFETDKFNPGNGTPRHALHLATNEELRPKIEDVKLSNLPLTIAYHPEPGEMWAGADVVFFETPNGGAMFSTGTINWFSSTPEKNYDNDVARISRNVIERFLDPAPFPMVDESEINDVNRVPENPEYEHADQQ